MTKQWEGGKWKAKIMTLGPMSVIDILLCAMPGHATGTVFAMDWWFAEREDVFQGPDDRHPYLLSATKKSP